MEHTTKPQSLAEYLGVVDPRPEVPYTPPTKLTAKQFCQAVLESSEFRTYVLNGLVLGDLPPAILIRIMDMGWGKPAERIEHTGRDGQPIETITQIRRVVVRQEQVYDPLDEYDELKVTKH